MDLDAKKIFKTLNPNKIWIPILIGLGIVVYLFYSDPNLTFEKLKLIFHGEIIPILFVFVILLIRDAGYAYRIRHLSDNVLSWTSSIYIIVLWEFASAVTPSVVGGSTIAAFILWKENINLGKSLAYVMVTAILDNMFFVIAAPLIFLFTPGDIFPSQMGLQFRFGKSLEFLFYLSYGLITIYTFIMAFALFYKPRSFKWILIKITSIRLFRRWKHAASEHGNEIISASELLKGKESSYWTKAIAATIVVWTARYFLLNCLFTAYVHLSFMDHIVVFSKQIIMWIVMLISPTPGSSGTAEYFFTQFFQRFLGDYTFITSIFWRMITYYPYLILGAIFLPRWIRRTFLKKKKENDLRNVVKEDSRQ